MTTVPTEDEVLGYFHSLSNWGRWGPDDELGTINHIGAEQRRRAAALIRDGVPVSCAPRHRDDAAVASRSERQVRVAEPFHDALRGGIG